MKINFAFFGTDEFAVNVLETLKSNSLIPSLIITTPDRPKGRRLILTPPPVKLWANGNNIKVIQPENLKDTDLINQISNAGTWDVFIVTAYGKIIPENVFNIPKNKTLNIHPSLLPHLRGPSPVATTILEDIKETGISIMQIDTKMDHGPIVLQEKILIEDWKNCDDLEKEMAIKGAELLVKILPDYLDNKITPKEQDGTKVSYCKLITKEMGLIDLNDDAYRNWRKILALNNWPGTYFFVKNKDKNIRVIIKKANYNQGILTIETVVPEGKKEMNYTDFKRGLK